MDNNSGKTSSLTSSPISSCDEEIVSTTENDDPLLSNDKLIFGTNVNMKTASDDEGKSLCNSENSTSMFG